MERKENALALLLLLLDPEITVCNGTPRHLLPLTVLDTMTQESSTAGHQLAEPIVVVRSPPPLPSDTAMGQPRKLTRHPGHAVPAQR